MGAIRAKTETQGFMRMIPMVAIECEDGEIQADYIDCDAGRFVYYNDKVYFPIPNNDQFEEFFDQVRREGVFVFIDSEYVCIPADWMIKNCPKRDRRDYEKLEANMLKGFRHAKATK